MAQHRMLEYTLRDKESSPLLNGGQSIELPLVHHHKSKGRLEGFSFKVVDARASELTIRMYLHILVTHEACRVPRLRSVQQLAGIRGGYHHTSKVKSIHKAGVSDVAELSWNDGCVRCGGTYDGIDRASA